MSRSSILTRKLKKIRVIVSDVDGVLTDGRIYLLENGDELKSFNAKDGSRVELAFMSGINILLVTSRKSGAVIRRAKEMKVPLVFKRDLKKSGKDLFLFLREKFRVDSSEVLYVGDDWSDLYFMKNAGVSATPFDGSAENKKIADLITGASSGGAVLSAII